MLNVYQKLWCFPHINNPSDKMLISAFQNFVEKKSSSTVGNAGASTCAWVSLKKENISFCFSISLYTEGRSSQQAWVSYSYITDETVFQIDEIEKKI